MSSAIPEIRELSREIAVGPVGSVELAPYKLDSMNAMTATLTNLTNGIVVHGYDASVFEFRSGEWFPAPPPGERWGVMQSQTGTQSGAVSLILAFAEFRVLRVYKVSTEIGFGVGSDAEIEVSATFVVLIP